MFGRGGPRARVDEHAEIERLEADADRGNDHLSVYGRLALEQGLRMAVMQGNGRSGPGIRPPTAPDCRT